MFHLSVNDFFSSLQWNLRLKYLRLLWHLTKDEICVSKSFTWSSQFIPISKEWKCILTQSGEKKWKFAIVLWKYTKKREANHKGIKKDHLVASHSGRNSMTCNTSTSPPVHPSGEQVDERWNPFFPSSVQNGSSACSCLTNGQMFDGPLAWLFWLSALLWPKEMGYKLNICNSLCRALHLTGKLKITNKSESNNLKNNVHT